jgi:thymidylate synthase ThyX
MPEHNGSHPPSGAIQPANETNVFAVYGVEPEVQAYAMAKYSRSALSMKDSLREISQQKTEKFLNTYYFQYGHRSIADLAHIALAIERLSILAAIAVADEQRWDGQERSTRYQDFKKSGYYVPEFGGDAAAASIYREAIEVLFVEYDFVSQRAFEYLASITPRPADMKQEAYERTLRARAFDIARYLLPLAANTSLGEIVNARTLENQVSHLLSHTHAEVRQIAEMMKRAAREPAYNPSLESLRGLIAEIRAVDPALAQRAEAELLKDIRVAPTLVKYADPNPYEIESRRELRQAAEELLARAPLASSTRVDLLEDEPIEIELPASLLYPYCHHAYRQVRQAIEGISASRRDEIAALGARHRGPHDELLREFRVGQPLRFDILMDIGGFRDMHRHRRCVQLLQDFTTVHGFETPDEIAPAGLEACFTTGMRSAGETADRLAKAPIPQAAMSAQYVIPLGYRKRALFKMDFAEAVYIAELRTGPAGHASYRRIAYAMYESVVRRYPSLARFFRVTDVGEPVDLLKR